MNHLNSNADNSQVHPTQREIAELAHEIWLESNRPSGRNDDFWFEAERRLLAVNNSDQLNVDLETLVHPTAAPSKQRRRTV